MCLTLSVLLYSTERVFSFFSLGLKQMLHKHSITVTEAGSSPTSVCRPKTELLVSEFCFLVARTVWMKRAEHMLYQPITSLHYISMFPIPCFDILLQPPKSEPASLMFLVLMETCQLSVDQAAQQQLHSELY